MTVFVGVALGLVVAVLALLLWPMWRQRSGGSQTQAGGNLVILQEQSRQLQAEQASGALTAAQYEAARLELAQRTLLEQAALPAQGQRSDSRTQVSAAPSRRSALVLGALLPLLALALYLRVGTPEALAPGATQSAGAGAEVSAAQVETMLATMTAQLEKLPPGQGDPAGWEMLGRTLASLQRFEEADRAYARAIALAPRNAQLLADRADLLMLLQGRTKGLGSGSDEPQRLIAEALAIDPKQLKALALAGSLAFEAQDFKSALQYWQRARQLATDGSAFAQGLDESLAAARSSLGPISSASAAVGASASGTGPAANVAVNAGKTNSKSSNSNSVSGTVRLAPALQSRLGSGDTLYIFARVAGGAEGPAPRMPVAILRVQAKDLPFDFKLDDSLAMSPDFKLSGQKTVLLQARVSRSGQAMPQSGDLVGQAGPVQVGASGVALVIDAVQP